MKARQSYLIVSLCCVCSVSVSLMVLGGCWLVAGGYDQTKDSNVQKMRELNEEGCVGVFTLFMLVQVVALLK